MLQTSREFQAAMTADNRRVFGRVIVDYTGDMGHTLDQSVTVSANERSNAAALLPQVVDKVTAVSRRWASADGSTIADGLSFPAPSVSADGQMGWWGVQMAGVGGAFSTPFPTLTVSFASRPVHSLRVAGDSARGEFPVDFEIRLLSAGGAVRHSRTVTGNVLMIWQEVITPVTEIVQCVLEVRRWSHAGRQAKIIEAFTEVLGGIQETYEGDNLISVNLLEEREVSQGGLPVGIISANEITLRLDNATRRFDAGNRASPLYQLLVPNRRIRAWLGLKGEGQGVNMQQSVDFNTGTRRNLVVNAGRLELPIVGAAAFARASPAHRQDGALVAAGLPRFEAGRFGQAVMAEDGVTNLLTAAQSSMEVDLNADGLSDGWTFWTADTLRTHLFSRPAALHHGSFSQRVEIISASTTSMTLVFVPFISIAAGLPYTMTAYILSNTSEIHMCFRYLTSEGVAISDSPNSALAPVNQLTRVTLTDTAPANATQMHIYILGITHVGEWVQFDSVQIEQRSHATTWQLGGTPRVGELMTIPTAGVVNPVEGTVEFVWQPINRPASTMVSQSTSPQIMRMGTYQTDNSWVLWNWFGGLRLFVRGAGATDWTGIWDVILGSAWYVLNRWYHIAVTWSGSNTFHVFVDGIQYGPFVSTHNFTGVAGNVLELGGSASSGHTNALYDDLRISNRARTDAEILASFNSGQPLPIDADTTYMLRADGNLNHGQGGDYTSPEYDLSTVGTVAASGISWHAPADGATRDVSARLDGQAWTPVVNGGTLPFTPGQLLTGRRLQLHALLRRG